MPRQPFTFNEEDLDVYNEARGTMIQMHGQIKHSLYNLTDQIFETVLPTVDDITRFHDTASSSEDPTILLIDAALIDSTNIIVDWLNLVDRIVTFEVTRINEDPLLVAVPFDLLIDGSDAHTKLISSIEHIMRNN